MSGDNLTCTITNPLKFMNKSYITSQIESVGLMHELFTINIIENNQMPEEIEVTFIQEALAQKFFQLFNGKQLEKDIDHKLEIKQGKSEKTPIIPSTKEIKFQNDYSVWIDTYYENVPNDEGLILTKKEEIERQKKVMGWLVKKIGKNALNGQSVMNISLPVYIFDKRTMLQVFTYELRESPYILNKVFYIQDPLEKLKYMSTYLISQIYLSPIILKPFNPIIGETYQCKIGNLNCYLEQTLHKPPTANIYCFDDDRLYKIHGFIATTANTGANYCKAKKVGKLMIEFKDGFSYRIYYPNVHVTGTTLGKKTFNCKHRALVIDEKNKLAAFMRFNPERKGLIKGLFSKKTEELPDKFEGKIVKLEDIKIDNDGPKHELIKEPKGMSELTGSWTKEVLYDGKFYWKRNLDILLKIYEPEYKLMSDSSFRQDLTFWIAGNEAEAQSKKEELEEIQRKDAKLRENYQKTLVPK